jgi:hypothetical protein
LNFNLSNMFLAYNKDLQVGIADIWKLYWVLAKTPCPEDSSALAYLRVSELNDIYWAQRTAKYDDMSLAEVKAEQRRNVQFYDALPADQQQHPELDVFRAAGVVGGAIAAELAANEDEGGVYQSDDDMQEQNAGPW